MSRRGLLVLGATGSVGRNTLDVAARHPDQFEIHALSGHRDVAAMLELCKSYSPRQVVMADPEAALALRDRLQDAGIKQIEVCGGPEALADLAGDGATPLVMSAIVGAAGLLPTLAALTAGKQVLIANKEPLVMAGALVMRTATQHQATVLPIDSEHNAVFQCLPPGSQCGRAATGIRRVVLTASGGPFRQTPMAQLAEVTVAQAVAHPNWVMGPKISVDSASMMNKGLELIEAQCLFQLAPQQLDVVIHPQSLVHALVEYQDGSTLAHLGQPDMRVPIAHALAWPQRLESGVSGLSLTEIGRLDFEAVDYQRFPCLKLAQQTLADQSGCAANVLNAANEVAVQGFLEQKLRFTEIHELIDHCLQASTGAELPQADDLQAVIAVDSWARKQAQQRLQELQNA